MWKFLFILLLVGCSYSVHPGEHRWVEVDHMTQGKKTVYAFKCAIDNCTATSRSVSNVQTEYYTVRKYDYFPNLFDGRYKTIPVEMGIRIIRKSTDFVTIEFTSEDDASILDVDKFVGTEIRDTMRIQGYEGISRTSGNRFLITLGLINAELQSVGVSNNKSLLIFQVEKQTRKG